MDPEQREQLLKGSNGPFKANISQEAEIKINGTGEKIKGRFAVVNCTRSMILLFIDVMYKLSNSVKRNDKYEHENMCRVSEMIQKNCKYLGKEIDKLVNLSELLKKSGNIQETMRQKIIKKLDIQFSTVMESKALLSEYQIKSTY